MRFGVLPLVNNRVFKGLAYFAVSVLVIFLLRGRLWEVLSSADKISEIPVWAWILMVVLESVSFACIWWLFKLVLPNVSWGVIAKSQLISNASSRVIPGGAATGGAVQYRVLTGAGVDSAAAGGSLAATSILTFMGLFFIPALAGLVALVSAPLERDLAWGAVGGAALLVVTGVAGYSLVRFNRPLLVVNAGIDSVASRVAGLFRSSWQKNPSRLVDERNRIITSIDRRWGRVFLASIGKWLADFLVLYIAIASISDVAGLEFPLLLLAYAGASVLVMIPVTPGGFGIVEVGLASLLISAGVVMDPALLAVFAYRLLSFWLPIVVGGVTLLFGNSKYLSEPAEAPTPAA